MMKHVYSYKFVLNKHLFPVNHAYLNRVRIRGSKAKCNGKPGLKERCLRGFGKALDFSSQILLKTLRSYTQ